MSNITQIIIAIFGSTALFTFLGILATGYFNKPKISAEASVVKITGDVTLLTSAETLVKTLTNRIDVMQKQSDDRDVAFNKRFNDFQTKLDERDGEILTKNKEISVLTIRVSNLESILRANNITY